MRNESSPGQHATTGDASKPLEQFMEDTEHNIRTGNVSLAALGSIALTISTDLEMEQMATTDMARRDRRSFAARAHREMVLRCSDSTRCLSRSSGRSISGPSPRCGLGGRSGFRTPICGEHDERHTDSSAVLCHARVVFECVGTQTGTDDGSNSETTGGCTGSLRGILKVFEMIPVTLEDMVRLHWSFQKM